KLERLHGGEQEPQAEVAVETAPVPPPVPVVVEHPVHPPPLPQPPPLPEVPLPAPWTPVLEAEPVMAASEPAGPTLSERLRAAMGGEEWEALVGGSLLNKLGALVLVVGVALFLGYSFTQMAPGGRAAIAMAVSVSLLGAGIWTERAARYQVFARGLIGAGWAGLYATAYAVYALPAAKVIDDPFLGSLGVLLVAAGMIGHSLRYQSQGVTAVAYFTAFAGLAATPSTPFAVIALIPLAVSVLYLAIRFEWYTMALFGLLATYGTCISRGSSGAPLFSTEALFLVYWILFEAFDVLRTQRRILVPELTWISPINALAFIGLSYTAWASKAPDQLWLMASAAAMLYLASALVRLVVRPPSSFDEADGLAKRVQAGSFEFSLTVSALLTALAIVAHVPGVWIGVGLAVEAEMLYLAGVRWNSAVLRGLGGIAFTFSLGRLFIYDYPGDGSTPVFGHQIENWTPPVLMHILLFYGNRALRSPNLIFSFAASALAGLVIFAEVPKDFVGSAWIVFAAILFEAGLRKPLGEFRLQAYLLAFAGTVFSLLAHGIFVTHQWGALTIGLVLFYANALRCRWTAQGILGPLEFQWAQRAGALATVLFSLLVLRNTVPEAYQGLAVCLLAGVLFELGLRKLPPELRVPSYLVWVFGVFQVLQPDPGASAKFAASPLALSYAAAALVAWWFCARVSSWPAGDAPEPDREILRHAMGAGGTLLAMRAMWIAMPETVVAAGWAAMALIWIELGARFSVRPFRWLGDILMAAVALRLALVNFHYPDKLLSVVPVIAAAYYLWIRLGDFLMARIYVWAAAIPVMILLHTELPDAAGVVGWACFGLGLAAAGRRMPNADLTLQSYVVAAIAFLYAIFNPPNIWFAVAVVAALYTGQALSDRHGRTFFSILATLLLTATLYDKVSGSLLTVAWGGEGLALLGIGFVARERLLRLQGLLLFFVCILKLFLYDLRNLETMYRILSFIALGLILLGVSWIYTKFREHVRRYL
ncbi:MAG: DUF2339 domain-containing protein, partial [Bryobacteraceae bacterium]